MCWFILSETYSANYYLALCVRHHVDNVLVHTGQFMVIFKSDHEWWVASLHRGAMNVDDEERSDFSSSMQLGLRWNAILQVAVQYYLLYVRG